MCGRPAGWRVLADRARLGRPGSRLPLRASVAGLGGGISWRSPAYSLFFSKFSAKQMDLIIILILSSGTPSRRQQLLILMTKTHAALKHKRKMRRIHKYCSTNSPQRTVSTRSVVGKKTNSGGTGTTVVRCGGRHKAQMRTAAIVGSTRIHSFNIQRTAQFTVT